MADMNINEVNSLHDTRISDYNIFLSTISKRRTTPALRASYDMMSKDAIFLSRGNPNPETFPIIESTLTLRDGGKLHLAGITMEAAMQYGSSAGDPEFRKWLIKLQRQLHNPPTLDDSRRPSSLDVIINTGCSEGIFKVMTATLNSGDAVLTEEYTFPLLFSTIVPLGARAVAVVSDDQGMIPSMLEKILSTWNEKTNGKRPQVLYCVTSASNPTAITWSLARKREIYKIAHMYNILIVEDDPYYMLQFNTTKVPTFLSLDVDGRVVRLDSFSKVISAGARLGYISGPRQFLHKIVQHMMCSVISASNLSQAVVFQTIQRMGHDGFIKHVENVRDFYQRRASMANQMAEKHLKGLAEWVMPTGGMFLWIKLLNIKDSSKVTEKAAKHGAVFNAGFCFCFDQTLSSYIRAAYSIVADDQMDKVHLHFLITYICAYNPIKVLVDSDDGYVSVMTSFCEQVGDP
ncbi:kynurenine/alpha-aminoadipate aminotransferase, mitochondrial-like [Gigantopelta aegis]|uniref:kynurenine/alpha-aminoadipate aminotransferase, mitochondrial-like n=1 Tax=Gigantopelta aegis TaxID=1735272 RepID=UPI001B88D7B4|nr:kynurenine/alpha-aminoadipate aminotransferase, mitochondrial-like [Gigantopelta aegis]